MGWQDYNKHYNTNCWDMANGTTMQTTTKENGDEQEERSAQAGEDGLDYYVRDEVEASDTGRDLHMVGQCRNADYIEERTDKVGTGGIGGDVSEQW